MATRSDVQSPDTEFAGLPKAVKLFMSVAENAPASGVAGLLRYNLISFNYGPYVIRPNATAPLVDAVVVQEPGVYEIHHQCGFVANSQMAACQIRVNGLGAAPDGSSNLSDTGATLSNGAYIVAYNCAAFVELKAGDIIDTIQLQTTSAGVPTNNPAGITWLYVEKRGGQY